jgi:hypothetical protein
VNGEQVGNAIVFGGTEEEHDEPARVVETWVRFRDPEHKTRMQAEGPLFVCHMDAFLANKLKFCSRKYVENVDSNHIQRHFCSTLE